MKSAKKVTDIERRRLQNRLAQRRFRQRHGQQKVPKQQGEQRRKGQANSLNNAQDDFDTPPDRNSWGFASPPTRTGWCHLGHGGNHPMLESIRTVEFDSNASSATADVGDDGSVSTNTASVVQMPTMLLSDSITPPEHSSNSFLPSSTTDNARCETHSLGARPMPNSGVAREIEKWQGPLHMAAQKGHNGIVCLLLQQNVDCNEGDSEDLTPLMYATIGGFQDVASSLLARGARVGATDSKHRSALHWAVVHRREALLRLLLEHCAGGGGVGGSADKRGVVNGYDADGKTPLHAAIDMGFEAGVRVLLEFGADVNSRAGVS